MLGATEIIKLTQAIGYIKDSLDAAENRVVGLIQSQGEEVANTCEETYVDFEDIITHSKSAMEILGEEFE